MRRLLGMMLLLFAALSVDAQEGTWKGELDVQGVKLPLVFHFEKDGCTMDSPSQGAKGIKAEKTLLSENQVKVIVAAIGVVYEGKNLGDSICGTFKQNGMTLPLTLVPGAVVVKRPQTPKAPFPYQEENVCFSNGKFMFNGTLALPKNYTKKTPVVLIDFVISLAGMAISGKETLLQQNRLGLSSVGMPIELVNSYCGFIGKVFDSLTEGKKLDDISLEDMPATFKPLWEKNKEQLNTPYMQHILKVDVSKQLPLIKCPVLALNGKLIVIPISRLWKRDLFVVSMTSMLWIILITYSNIV